MCEEKNLMCIVKVHFSAYDVKMIYLQIYIYNIFIYIILYIPLACIFL